jgi:hypothetical protein
METYLTRKGLFSEEGKRQCRRRLQAGVGRRRRSGGPVIELTFQNAQQICICSTISCIQSR